MVDQTPLIPVHEEDLSGPKIGHSCCGCCCDTRRAVIIVNLVFLIILGIFDFVFYMNGGWMYDNSSIDPRVALELENAYHKLAPVAGVGVLVGFLVVFGAITYRASIIYLGIVYLIIDAGCTIGFLWPVMKDEEDKTGGAIWVSLAGPLLWVIILIYPHVIFALEIKNGIMSRETYQREKQCGCCNC